MRLSGVLRGPHLTREAVGFLVFGGVGFFIDFVSFNALILWGTDFMTANIVAISTSALVGLAGNFFFSFGKKNLSFTIRLASRYVLITVVTVVLNQLAVWMFVASFPSSSLIAVNIIKVLIIGVLLVFRFAAYRLYVFVHPLNAQGLIEAGASSKSNEAANIG